MFRNFGLPELLIVLAIVLLIFGAGRLPAVAASLRKAVDAFRKGSTDDEVPARRRARRPKGPSNGGAV